MSRTDLEPVTPDEYTAARRIFLTADDTTTKAELRRHISGTVQTIRDHSGTWSVYAESWDIPGPGQLVSEHPNEAAALTECIRLNRASTSNAGACTIRKKP